MEELKNKRVLVTGGCGFIGSHIVDKLLQVGAEVIVLDNLITGSEENLKQCIDKIEFIKGDISDPQIANQITQANKTLGQKCKTASADSGYANTDDLKKIVDEDIQVDPELNYVFRSLAVNLRGFNQNIRNGNSYALINSELRIPIFRYLYNRPLKSNFFDKFQIVAFADAGTAWTGLHPYSEENSLNKRIIKKNPFEITVITVGEPIVAGYGFGARTELFGYFIKFDYAWGIEGNEILGNMKYLSFGLDF